MPTLPGVQELAIVVQNPTADEATRRRDLLDTNKSLDNTASSIQSNTVPLLQPGSME
jgi:hypothetical protein